MPEIYAGWKEIAGFIGVCIKTARAYHFRMGMPILRTPTGRPVVTASMYLAWLTLINSGPQDNQKSPLQKNH